MALSLLIGLLFALSFGLNYFDQGSLPDDWTRAGVIDFVVFGCISIVMQFFVLRIAPVHTDASPNLPTRGWKWLVHFLQTVSVKLALILGAVIGLGCGLSTGLIVELKHGYCTCTPADFSPLLGKLVSSITKIPSAVPRCS